MAFLVLGITAVIAWLISTIGAGGGAILLLPVVNMMLGAQAVAPVVTLGTMLGGPSRIYLFRRNIDWSIVRWYVPGAIPGALAGAAILSLLLKEKIEWAQILIGIFLISVVFQYRFGKRKKTFSMRVQYFLPIAFVVAFISGVVGAAGPIVNPFYLNYGTLKENMIGTKSVNAFVMHVVKLITYTGFGALTLDYFWLGLVIGIGAAIGSWLGKRTLKKMDDDRFKQIVLLVMVVAGVQILWKQRAILMFWT